MTGEEMTYDVRIWGISRRAWQSGTTYRVRWVVAGREWHESFTTRALAESFRADLLSLARQGQPFRRDTGRPISWEVERPALVSWYEHACAYVDMKSDPRGREESARHRRESLATVTPLCSFPSRADRRRRRCGPSSMGGHSMLDAARRARLPRISVARNAGWRRTPVRCRTSPIPRYCVPLSMRSHCGWTAARLRRRRSRASGRIFYNAVEYAVELGHLAGNPIPSIKWRAPKITEAVNPRVVINHGQARALLDAVDQRRPSLVAFFAVMYYAALRPGEAVELRKEALSLPASGWGEAALEHVGSVGRSVVERVRYAARAPASRKHRGAEEVRIVPSAPELTALLRKHLDEHGTHRRPTVPRRPRWPALREPLRPGVGPCSRCRADTRRSHLAARTSALRPPPCRGVDLAQRWRARTPSGRVGRTQRGRPTSCLRQVHRRSGRDGTAARGGSIAAGPFMIASVMRPWMPVNRRTGPDTAGLTRTAPDQRVCWSGAVHPGCGG